MLREVEWGDLDIMVVDMPPGTGDAQLTMAQQVPLAGAVIVSTPQDIALLDARKGLNMFRKVDVPVLGIVENMSYFLCPHCGGRSEIFSHGGARREAELLGTEFLGEVPLDLQIRETSDSGHPITVSDPENPHSAVFRQIAARVWEKVSGADADGPRPAPHRHRIGPLKANSALSAPPLPATSGSASAGEEPVDSLSNIFVTNEFAAVERGQAVHDRRDEFGVVLDVTPDRLAHEIACRAAVAGGKLDKPCLFFGG